MITRKKILTMIQQHQEESERILRDTQAMLHMHEKNYLRDTVRKVVQDHYGYSTDELVDKAVLLYKEWYTEEEEVLQRGEKG